MNERVALYARVSTRQQEQEATIASQIDQILAYAMQVGYQITEAQQYVDQAVSGSQLQRGGLDRLRDAVAAREVDVVLCVAPDRLARSLGLQQVLLAEFRRAGVAVYFVNQPQLGDDPPAQLLLQLQGAFAEYESTVIRERLQRGRLFRWRAGQVPARAPYGYRYQVRTAEAAPAWHVDAAQAAVVEQIFQWYASSGWTLRQIEDALNTHGIAAPQGGTWCHSSIHGLLKQSAYRGIAYVNRALHPQASIGESRKHGAGRLQTPRHIARPEEEWIAITVPALIPKELWATAQERLTMNAQLATRNAQRTYLFSGLLVCQVCGHTLSGRTDRTGTLYYACRYGGKHCPPDVVPHSCTVRGDVIEPLVWQALTDLLLEPQRIQHAWEALQTEAQPQPAEVANWHTRHAALLRQEQRLLDAYQTEALSLEDLQQRRPALQREIRSLEHRLAQLQPAPAQVLSLERFTQRIQQAFQAPDMATQQEVIRLLMNRIVVSETTITIEHIIPTEDVCQLGTVDGRR